MKHFAALALVLAWPLVGYGAPDSAAALFLDRCSTCHTVGQPDEVLDLGVAVTWSVPDLRAAVLRMEDNAGPMTPEEIDAIVGLLKSPDLSARLAGDAPKTQQAAESGSPDTGRRLFYGEQRLAAGGAACFACHAVNGRGGTLAADLTKVHARMGTTALVAATERPRYPLMSTSYAKRPVTRQEALDIAAFLAAPGPAESGDPMPLLLGGASGLVAVALGGVAIVFRSRRAGVRARLVRDSSRRT